VEYELRIYTVKPGAMAAWAAEWSRHVAPLRRKFGFEVLGPWTSERDRKFVWILGYGGVEGWDAADAAYYASEARRSISPEPTSHLERAEHLRMHPA
jgi:hypothetical protein